MFFAAVPLPTITRMPPMAVLVMVLVVASDTRNCKPS